MGRRPLRKLPAEVAKAVEEQESQHRKKNKLSILKVGSAKKEEDDEITIISGEIMNPNNQKNIVDWDEEYSSKRLKLDESSDSELEVVMPNKTKKTSKVSKKKNPEEDIINEYIDEFKRQYDLKINNYFKQLLTSLDVVDKKISKSLDELNHNLQKIRANHSDIGEKVPNDIFKSSSISKISSESDFGLHKQLTTTFSIDSNDSFSLPKAPNNSIQSQNHWNNGTFNSNKMAQFVPVNRYSSSDSTIRETPKMKSERPDYEKMMDLAESAGSIPHLASKLLVEFFSNDELYGDVNVRGVSLNGSQPKKALDAKRIEIIKKFCLDQISDGTDKESMWRSCINAMNKKIHSLNLNRNF